VKRKFICSIIRIGMNAIIVATVVLCIALYCLRFQRKEGMKVEFKMDVSNPLEGVQAGLKGLVDGTSQQLHSITNLAAGFIPFKETVREWHRKWRRKNIGLG